MTEFSIRAGLSAIAIALPAIVALTVPTPQKAGSVTIAALGPAFSHAATPSSFTLEVNGPAKSFATASTVPYRKAAVMINGVATRTEMGRLHTGAHVSFKAVSEKNGRVGIEILISEDTLNTMKTASFGGQTIDLPATRHVSLKQPVNIGYGAVRVVPIDHGKLGQVMLEARKV